MDINREQSDIRTHIRRIRRHDLVNLLASFRTSTDGENHTKATSILLHWPMYIDAKARQLALVLVELLAKAILVLLDGWHLTRAQLDQFPDPKLARDRRGSHWNFDGPNLREEVLPETERIITAPSFDHAIKDPTSHAVQIHPQHRIVIIEGLYTALDVDSWREAALLLDERWYLELDFEEAQKRLVNRNLVSGVAKDPAEAVWRAEANGMPSERAWFMNTR
ncbi:hypothetical protein HHX47_DHR8000407 [Lentinula edodes]|nr:hypothetical protein HHX47_DHR8000407 [Lentinula edodes]